MQTNSQMPRVESWIQEKGGPWSEGELGKPVCQVPWATNRPSSTIILNIPGVDRKGQLQSKGSQVYFNPCQEKGTSYRRSHSFTLSNTDRVRAPLSPQQQIQRREDSYKEPLPNSQRGSIAFHYPSLPSSTSSVYSFLEQAMGLGTFKNKSPLSPEIPSPTSVSKPTLRSSTVAVLPRAQRLQGPRGRERPC